MFQQGACRCKNLKDPKKIWQLTLQAIRHLNCGEGGTPVELYNYVTSNHKVPLPENKVMFILKDTLKRGICLGFLRRNYCTGRYYMPNRSSGRCKRAQCQKKKPPACKKTCPKPKAKDLEQASCSKQKPKCPKPKPRKQKPKCPKPKAKCPANKSKAKCAAKNKSKAKAANKGAASTSACNKKTQRPRPQPKCRPPPKTKCTPNKPKRPKPKRKC